MYYSLFLVITMLLQSESFKSTQLKKVRVKAAYDEKEQVIRQYFQTKGLDYSKYELFIRAFKKEGILETWIRDKGATSYTLLQTYAFCASSGTLGPKRKEGDLQIPEGFYHLNHFNPESNFHLSLGVSYPNASDKILSDKRLPGGAIYIHGNCVTVGCIPITDDKIKELYILAVEARNNGQRNIPIHIYPCRMDEQNLLYLRANFNQTANAFWSTLVPIYQDFENTRQLKKISVSINGAYALNSEAL